MKGKEQRVQFNPRDPCVCVCAAGEVLGVLRRAESLEQASAPVSAIAASAATATATATAGAAGQSDWSVVQRLTHGGEALASCRFRKDGLWMVSCDTAGGWK
eukprot:2535332-Rhodomonas_salina.1